MVLWYLAFCLGAIVLGVSVRSFRWTVYRYARLKKLWRRFLGETRCARAAATDFIRVDDPARALRARRGQPRAVLARVALAGGAVAALFLHAYAQGWLLMLWLVTLLVLTALLSTEIAWRVRRIPGADTVRLYIERPQVGLRVLFALTLLAAILCSLAVSRRHTLSQPLWTVVDIPGKGGPLRAGLARRRTGFSVHRGAAWHAYRLVAVGVECRLRKDQGEPGPHASFNSFVAYKWDGKQLTLVGSHDHTVEDMGRHHVPQ